MDVLEDLSLDVYTNGPLHGVGHADHGIYQAGLAALLDGGINLLI